MSVQPTRNEFATHWYIRRAGVSDLPELLTLFDSATTWLLEHDLAGQWGDLLPSRQPDFPPRLCNWVEHHLVLLAFAETQQAHGCIVLGWEAPPYLEPALAQQMMQDAAYIYSFVSLMQEAARGVGAALLAQAALEAQALGKHYLRLDCWADNPALCSYYQRAGFISCGAYADEGWRGVLMEKRLAARS